MLAMTDHSSTAVVEAETAEVESAPLPTPSELYLRANGWGGRRQEDPWFPAQRRRADMMR
ncbi:hypothetical protein D5S17_28090 [Pseudonocardiaceae bacterium YIM PH 21723]|nr:hypothetical protein D5S17_28090 [Pseudonocardiaceae bacterium YIM PH 21723]